MQTSSQFTDFRSRLDFVIRDREFYGYLTECLS